jgi:hypothetical protein
MTILFLLILPHLLITFLPYSGWPLMLAYIFMMFTTLKIATWLIAGFNYGTDNLLYAGLWAGMNPTEFQSKNKSKPSFASGIISFMIGLILSIVALKQEQETIRATMILVSMFFLFHFGLLELNARLWQYLGRNVKPLMNAPWKSKSLSEFWGKRWNMAFRDAAHLLIFNPLKKKTGPKTALLTVFLFSGLVHEAVISVPAAAGYGGPMLYFLLQFTGITIQKKWHSFSNTLTTWLILLLPIPLLFHQPFLHNVFLPLSNKIGG